MVELLTVVAIMAVLTALAVPTYLKYRKESGLKAMAADAQNIKKAALICASMFPFSACDTDAEIGIQVFRLGTIVKNPPHLCFPFKRDIGGIAYNQCVHINTSTGGHSETNSEPFCNSKAADHLNPGSFIYTRHPNNIECGSAADCPATHSFCYTGKTGLCSPAAKCG